MKRTILTAALAACALSATAQIMEERNPVPMTPGGGRVYRTEVVPYDARHDAEARNRDLADVRDFVGALRRKIDAEDEPALIHTVRGAGYKLAAAG